MELRLEPLAPSRPTRCRDTFTLLHRLTGLIRVPPVQILELLLILEVAQTRATQYPTETARQDIWHRDPSIQHCDALLH